MGRGMNEESVIASQYPRVAGKPAITVVVALYNCEQFIGENIASLRRQTFDDFEVIIVDDCSTDGSVAAARKAIGDDERFTLVELDVERGPSCRNEGFDRARGDYVVILDSDDYLVDDALAKLIVRARSQRLDDLYFSAESFYEREEDFMQIWEDYSQRPSFEGVASGKDLFVFFENRDSWYVQGALRMVSRDLLETHHIRMPEGIIHEDVLFTFYSMVNAQRSSFLNEPIYRRRIRAGSVMNRPKRTIANVKGHFVSCRAIRAWMVEHEDELDEPFTAAMGRRLAFWAELCTRDWDCDVEAVDKDRFLAELSPDEKLDFTLNILSVGRPPLTIRNEYEESVSYRTGRLVTAPARFVVDRVRSVSLPGRQGKMKPQDETPAESGKAEVRVHTAGADVFSPQPAEAPHDASLPRVSVIVPAYNAADHIGQAIESVLAQTFDDFEVICVDDGSTDGTASIVRGLAERDGRVRLITQANAGPGCARNAGLAEAQGEFVYCLDADDFVERDLLARCVEALDRTGADMVLFAFRTFNERAGRAFPAEWGMRGIGTYPSYPEGSFDRTTSSGDFFQVVQNVPWNKVVRRSLIDREQIAFQEIYLSEDLMYSLPAAACARSIVRIVRPLMCHREFSGANMMEHKDAHPVDFLDAFATFKAWLASRGLYGALRLSWQTWLLNAVNYNLATYGDFDAFAAAYDLLCDDDLRTFDLADLDPADVEDVPLRRLLEALQTGSRERFLLACSNNGMISALDEKCRFQCAQTRATIAKSELDEGMRTGQGAVGDVTRAARGFFKC